MPPKRFDEWAWLARIRRAQGRKGEVFAEILTDFPEKFSERRRLWLVSEGKASARVRQGDVTAAPITPREVELVNHWPHKGGVVLHFAGVESITVAEALVGLGVAIPKAERAPLSNDEAYVGDLIGCELVDVAGSEPVTVGSIEDIDLTAGQAPILMVRGRSNGEILIPFAKSYLRRLDTPNKRVEMALPEGLVDLNESAG